MALIIDIETTGLPNRKDSTIVIGLFSYHSDGTTIKEELIINLNEDVIGGPYDEGLSDCDNGHNIIIKKYRSKVSELCRIYDLLGYEYGYGNELKSFFYKQNNFNEDQIQFKIFDLKNCEHHQKISELRKTQSNLLHDRCYEIQYSKFFWCLENSINPNFDYVFWIDAGLSHSGLIPPKYLDQTNLAHFNLQYKTS